MPGGPFGNHNPNSLKAKNVPPGSMRRGDKTMSTAAKWEAPKAPLARDGEQTRSVLLLVLAKES